MVPPGAALEARERDCVRAIWSDRELAAVAMGDQLGACRARAPFRIDVSEQPAVAIPSLRPEVKPHPPPLGHPTVESARLPAKALHGRARLDRLGRIDADVANCLRLRGKQDLDGVAVDRP